MPQRVNTKSDIGTSKIASDSYDTNNIFLTDQGWVYRHWKGDPTDLDCRYWDEIIVAGQVTQPGTPDYGVSNDDFEPTLYSGTGEGSEKYKNPLGTTGYEPLAGASGPPADGVFDVGYSGQDGVNLAAEAQADIVAADPTKRSAGSAVYTQFPEDTTSTDDSGSPSDDGNNGGGSTPAPSNVTLVFTGADGTSSYTSAGGANASVSIEVGGTLTITNNTGGHPVDVRVADGGDTVSTGTLLGAPANSGESLTWDTTGVTPGTYYYQCTAHSSMVGQIIVTA